MVLFWPYALASTSLLLIFEHGNAVRPLNTLASDAGIGSDKLARHLHQQQQQHHRHSLFLRHLQTESSLVGNVALTTATGTPTQDIGANTGTTGSFKDVGSSVYGPFEAGFGEPQDLVIERQFGCTSDVTRCYSEGGVDVATAEAICATSCGIDLPRTDNGVYYGLIDTCGGHTMSYHFHRNMNCLYTENQNAHSPKLAETVQNPSQNLYGKWEDWSRQTKPALDACNGHYGYTPDSPDIEVYHYHLSEAMPFTIGCYGPNADNSLVTVSQCRALYSECSDTEPLEIINFDDHDGNSFKIPYQRWCPCFDGSGLGMDGGGLNVGNVDPSRLWIQRQYLTGRGWVTIASDTFAKLAGYQTGVSIVEVSGTGPGPSGPPPEPPTPAPTPVSCFSASSKVNVLGKGDIAMESLETGDYVHSSHGFTKVLGFLHLQREMPATYLQLSFRSQSKLLSVMEVSAEHLLFSNGVARAAGTLRSGDLLDGRDKGTWKITEIKAVQRTGVFAPATESGDVFVNGVLASNYVNLLSVSAINQHSLSHAVLAPLRLWCRMWGCTTETYTEQGYSSRIEPFVRISAIVNQWSPFALYMATILLAPFVALCIKIDLAIVHGGIMICGLCFFAVWFMVFNLYKNRQPKCKQG